MTEFFEWREAPAARFAVIGDPISHSLSPKMQNAALRAMGEPGEYVAIRVPFEETHQALSHLAGKRYQGANVTVPDKGPATTWLRSADPIAQRVGAANTIDLHGSRGTNTDGAGFLESLDLYGIEAANVLILGAGGSARAIIASLPLDRFVVFIWNRTMSRAATLCRELGMAATVVPTPGLAGFDLIVNATSSSLQEDQRLDLDWSVASPDAVAYDLSYPAERSDFLRQAAHKGLKTIDGIELLIAQGARSLEWWLGKPVPREVMREALR